MIDWREQVKRTEHVKPERVPVDKRNIPVFGENAYLPAGQVEAFNDFAVPRPKPFFVIAFIEPNAIARIIRAHAAQKIARPRIVSVIPERVYKRPVVADIPTGHGVARGRFGIGKDVRGGDMNHVHFTHTNRGIGVFGQFAVGLIFVLVVVIRLARDLVRIGRFPILIHRVDTELCAPGPGESGPQSDSAHPPLPLHTAPFSVEHSFAQAGKRFVNRFLG